MTNFRYGAQQGHRGYTKIDCACGGEKIVSRLRLSRVSHPPFVGYRKYYVDVQRREEAFDLSGVEHPMGAFTTHKGVS